MAIVHAATLKPSKLEVIGSWMPGQPWFAGDASAKLELVGSFRFDDPDGEVGVQTLLVRSGDDSSIYQVPMTYRAAPLANAAEALMGEMEHSVLGHRYVYDGCHDAVYLGELVRAVLTGGTEVIEYSHREGSDPEALPASMHVRGSGKSSVPVPALGPFTVTAEGENGSITTVRSGDVEVCVVRLLDQSRTNGDVATLTGEWGDGEPHCLATVRVGAAS